MTQTKKHILMTLCLGLVVMFGAAFTDDCDGRPANTTAKDEQALTEENQRNLLSKQPPPKVTWSLERDNLIKRFKLQNDRSLMFYMYVFIEGHNAPVGYYIINKVSSVDSQLTNPEQIITHHDSAGRTAHAVPSPAEDGSYGTNGQGVFGFTPDDVYVETNLKYIVSTIPLNFPNITQLAIINSEQARSLVEKSKQVMK